MCPSGRVARVTGVEHQDLAPRSSEGEGSAQPNCAAPDDDDVVRRCGRVAVMANAHETSFRDCEKTWQP